MVRVQSLGTLAVGANGERVTALGAQPLRGSVFLYLCVEREATREALVRMFWPDREEDKARRLLSQTLYELKRLLGEDWFMAVGEVVRIVNVSVDVHSFEQTISQDELDRALALYQGRFLADFTRFDSAEFNAWVDRKAAQYERAHRKARRERIKHHLAGGQHQAALAVAQRWSELDPLDDEAQHRTIELLHTLGRRSEALHAFDRYLSHLKEFDLQPLDETRALAATIREGQAQQLPAAAIKPEPAAIVSRVAVAAKLGEPKPVRPRRRTRFAGAIGLAAVILLMAFVLNRGSGDVATASIPRDSAGSELSRVAVLYFEVAPPNEELEYLAKGITEALIDELTQVQELNVISRHGVKPYQGKEIQPDSIQRALGVGTIVEGSLQRAGDSIRARVYLIDAHSGKQLDSQLLSRPVGSGFQLEDDVARHVASFLRKRLGREIAVRRIAHGASNEEAYRLYQKAHGFHDQVRAANPQLRAADPSRYQFLLRSADSLLIRAQGADPRWLEPTLLRGRIAYDRGQLTNAPGSKRSDEYLKTAINFANDVLKIEREHARALELRGLSYAQLAANSVRDVAVDSLHARAEEDLFAAVTIDPSLALSWSELGTLRRLKGDFAEATLYSKRAYEADAFLHETPVILEQLYRIAMEAEQFDQAEKWCRVGFDSFPNEPDFVECHLMLPAANPDKLISMDSAYRLERRLTRLTRASESWDYKPIFHSTLLARLWAKNGQADSARALLSRARLAVTAGDTLLAPSFGFDAAHVLLLSGDTAAAIEEVTEFVTTNPRYRKYVLEGVAFRGIRNRLPDLPKAPTK